MRRVWICLLAAGLASAAPIRARATDGKAEANAKKDAKAESVASRNSAFASELEEMKQMIQAQAQKLAAQQQQIEALEKQIQVSPAGAYAAVPTDPPAPGNPPAASATSAPAPKATAAALTRQDGDGASPLQFHIGSAYITPVGFMDFTSVWRSKNGGSGIGTNFAGIPYGNTYQTNLTELRLSMQNSRIGFRVDARVKGAHVIGYLESDFLGFDPGNVAVSSNSNSLRSRLFWVDLRKGQWEVLGGQSWSLITPGRVGISPLPGDIFFTQNIDVNYQLGLVWGRIPELRVVYHPSDKLAFAVALDSSEQYIGGSAGGSTITLPSALSSVYSNGELNAGGSTLGVPNVAPDVIAKLALDPSKHLHFEIGGVERQFRLFNPATSSTSSATGGGGFVNLGFDLFPGFRVLTNNYWSDGGGRYIFGQAPDLVARADGSPSLVHSGSTVTGFEFTHANTLLYAYYGGLYVSRNVQFDTTGKLIGYGYTGAPSGQNRAVQEATFGLNETLWKSAAYGALNLMGQYSYLTRDPWYVAAGQPKNANLNMFFLNLRYTLPGSAPAMK